MTKEYNYFMTAKSESKITDKIHGGVRIGREISTVKESFSFLD